ncbi:MAG: transporter [Acetobacteraceae bacterium]|nr:transporter [Acetobacteraceae bacterium]
MAGAWLYTLIPAAAAVAGAAAATWRRPGPALTSAVQHFAAGVVFAAAASEILPDLKHQGSAISVVLGGGLGVAVMLLVRWFGERAKGPVSLVATVAVDVLIDGLVLGIGFAAGVREGLLLTVALTLEVLFLGLSITTELGEALGNSRAKVILAVAGIAALLPLGAVAGTPVGRLPGPWLAGFFAFGLIALLYLVTEELLVEAHEGGTEAPWVAAMFFVGFLLLLLLEEATG